MRTIGRYKRKKELDKTINLDEAINNPLTDAIWGRVAPPEYSMRITFDDFLKIYKRIYNRFMRKLPYRDRYGRCRSYKRRYCYPYKRRYPYR